MHNNKPAAAVAVAATCDVVVVGRDHVIYTARHLPCVRHNIINLRRFSSLDRSLSLSISLTNTSATSQLRRRRRRFSSLACSSRVRFWLTSTAWEIALAHRAAHSYTANKDPSSSPSPSPPPGLRRRRRWCAGGERTGRGCEESVRTYCLGRTYGAGRGSGVKKQNEPRLGSLAGPRPETVRGALPRDYYGCVSHCSYTLEHICIYWTCMYIPTRLYIYIYIHVST